MTDELNRASAEPETMNPEETVPALLSENHPIGADDVTAVEENTEWDNMPGIVTVELPPDWLKPMEEDEDGVESVRSMYVPFPYFLAFCLHLVEYSLGCMLPGNKSQRSENTFKFNIQIKTGLYR